MKAVCLLLAIFAFTWSAGAQQPDTLFQTLPSPKKARLSFTQMGSAVAVEGDFAVAGAPNEAGRARAGFVKVFDATTGALRHVLRKPGWNVDTYFGCAVAMSGTRLVVGVKGDREGGENAGSVYVYDLAGQTPTEPVLILRSPAPTKDALFGTAAAISGTRVLVGAPGDLAGVEGAGRAYVFDLSNAQPGVPVAILENPTREPHRGFGNAVAISGTRVVVSHTNSVYLYDLSRATPAMPAGVLVNPEPNPESRVQFGKSVAISGARLLVGAPGGPENKVGGNVYAYDLNSPKPSTPGIKIPNPSKIVDSSFGMDVALSGTRVIVGSFNQFSGFFPSGSAYVYDLASSTPAAPVDTLGNPTPAEGDEFGGAVAISGTRVVVGANRDRTGAPMAGSAYVYDLHGVDPTTPTLTLNDPELDQYDGFGDAMAISGTRLVVGAGRIGRGGTGGKAFVFDLAGAKPTAPVAILENPNPGFNDSFGVSVAISGTRIVVGAYSDASGENMTGCAYVYDLASPTPSLPILTLLPPIPVEEAYFGRTVAISGNRVAVNGTIELINDESRSGVFLFDLGAADPARPVLSIAPPGFNALLGTGFALDGTRLVASGVKEIEDEKLVRFVYAYDLAGKTPATPILSIRDPEAKTESTFGRNLALSGTRIIVAASEDDPDKSRDDCLYLYDLTAAKPGIPAAILRNPNPRDVQFFGGKPAISGTRVAARGFRVEAQRILPGPAYVYDLSSPTPAQPIVTLAPEQAGSGVTVAIDGETLAVAGDESVKVFTPKNAQKP